MVDDPDDAPATSENVTRLSDNPAFKSKQAERSHGAPQLNSRQESIDWVDESYAIAIIMGKLMVINERTPDEYCLMSKKDFIDSIENIRIVVQDEDKPKITPVSDLWLKWPGRRMYERG